MATSSNIGLAPQTPLGKPGAAEWFNLIDIEEGENLASAIVDAIVQRGQEVLFEKHIESQVLPYAVQFAKSTLLKIVEWRFFSRDSGEILPETWDPDEEPKPAIPDSWARGAIPIKRASPLPQTKKIPREAHSMSLTAVNDQALCDISGIASVELPVGGPRVGSSVASVTSATRKSLVSHASQGSKVFGKAPARRVVSISASEEVTESPVVQAEHAIVEENKRIFAKLQNLEKDGGRADIAHDMDGRIIVVKKPKASKLLSQGVKATVIKSEETGANAKQTDQQPRPPEILKHDQRKVISKLTRLRPEAKKLMKGNQESKSATISGVFDSSQSIEPLDMSTSYSGPGDGFIPDTCLDIPLLASDFDMIDSDSIISPKR
ncbi:hypothetical protein HDU84_003398 [Entophlyctis sp. JEL0112]|nr:hypothetical protein HDU84_003398 [Entophlyctis sp. JEL0112]